MNRFTECLALSAFFLFSISAIATPVSSCTPDVSSCNVYEGQLLTYPTGGYAFAGDVIVQNAGGTKTFDVFRIFNDLLDTGGGTGFGDRAFLYGADINDLPDPSTYSLNAVTILLGSSGPPGFYETDYTGNGTLYRLFTPTPEPSTFALLAVGILLGTGLCARRLPFSKAFPTLAALPLNSL